MSQIANRVSTPDEFVPLVVALTAIKRLGGRNLPSTSTLREHGYQGRFDLVRLASGKLAVRSADLPAIAAQYGAPVGNVDAAA